MDLLYYFDKIETEKFQIDSSFKKNKFAFFNIDKNTFNFKFKNLEQYKAAIIGIPEERNSKNKGTAKAPDKIRESLYQLNIPSNIKIIDLGNIKIGNTLKDTYFAISDICQILISKSVIPIIIGGSQDLTYGNFLAYEKLKLKTNLVCIDPKFDLGYLKNDFDSTSYLGQIILNNRDTLFNFTNLGYQSYYTNKEEITFLNKLNFDTVRLGKLRFDLKEAEPIIRDADLLSIDISSIKQSDAPAHFMPSTNGFYGEEVCQLAKYAGLSDKLSSFGIYDINPDFDNNNQTINLAAQIIWYFIDALTTRKINNPKINPNEYTKFIVNFEKNNKNIIFYKNNFDNRWWMEIGILNNSIEKYIIACSYEDYKLACSQEIPERWLNTIQKIN
ncbi:MAG: formimidoylglutamase [Bacteroidales bacterium]|nr:formimidoylglutamase [Bacteroidales bacterium]MBN2755891.1 formimidoylglutamase [Bacteroidales bacterium]